MGTDVSLGCYKARNLIMTAGNVTVTDASLHSPLGVISCGVKNGIHKEPPPQKKKKIYNFMIY